jgi:phenylpyruvate tautomerase
MPYLSIQTNINVSEEQRSDLAAAASKIVATQLNKPEAYVMTSFMPVQQMTLGGDKAATAFLELRSIGVPDAKRNPLCVELTKLVTARCGIPADRIFIVLEDVPARLWGYNGAMLG